MQQLLGTDQLSLSEHRRGGPIPKVTPELRRRVQAYGIVDPVVVRRLPTDPNRYEILSNPESYLVAGELRIDEVPVVIREDLDDEEVADIVRAQYQSAKSNPIDEAEWYQEKLTEQSGDSGDANIARLARLTGKSRSHVSRSLALLTLPLEVQHHFRQGDLKAAHGRFLVKLQTASKQKSLAARAVKNGLSVRDLEALVNKTPRRHSVSEAPTSSPPQEKDPDTLRLERKMTDLVGSPVEIDAASGKLTIDFFKNYETLDGILQRLGYDPGY